MKKKLLTILLSIFVMMATFVNVVNAETSISSILPFGFPNSYSDGWKKEGNNNIRMYLSDGHLCVGEDSTSTSNIKFDVNTNLSLNGDVYECDISDFNLKFYSDGNISKIEVSYSGGDASVDIDLVKGTFKALTIGDILNTVDGFPSSDSLSNVPTNAWVSNNGKMFIRTDNNQLSIAGVGIGFDLNSQLILEADNKYKYSNNGITVYFNTEDSKLVSVEISGCTLFANANGTYSAPLTIADIIPSNFPITEESAWTNGTYKIFKIENTIKLNGSVPVLSMENIVTPVGDGNYCFTNDVGTLTLIMDNGKFTSIVASGFASPYEDANGTYSGPLTVGDILEKSEHTFPTSEGSGWVKENYSTTNRVYIDGENMKIGTTPFPLSGIVTKEGDNYKYVSGGIMYASFIMESNILKKIYFFTLSAPATGDYVPYKYEIEATESKPEGYTGNLVFKTNGQFTNESDVIVKINGTPITLNTDYIVENGSIKVTLLGNYLKTLAPNIYTISIGVAGSYDEITSQFIITGSVPTPTPDPDPVYSIPNTSVDVGITNNHSLLKISCLSILAIGTYMALKKKDN